MLRFQEGVLSRLWALRARWASWAWLVAVASVLARLVLALRVLPAWPIPSRLPRALTPVDWTPRTLTTASPQRSCATSMTRCFATTRRPARWLQACPRCRDFRRRSYLYVQAAGGCQVPRRHRLRCRGRQGLHRASARAQPHRGHALRWLCIWRPGLWYRH